MWIPGGPTELTSLVLSPHLLLVSDTSLWKVPKPKAFWYSLDSYYKWTLFSCPLCHLSLNELPTIKFFWKSHKIEACYFSYICEMLTFPCYFCFCCSILLKHSLIYSQLALNLPCSQGWPWMSDLPVSNSQVLGLWVCPPHPRTWLSDAGGWTQNFMHARQVLYQQSYFPQLIVLLCLPCVVSLSYTTGPWFLI